MTPVAQKHHITLESNLVLLSTSRSDSGKIYTAEAYNIYMGLKKTSAQFVLSVAGK